MLQLFFQDKYRLVIHMKLTKERKVLGAVLGVALLALVVNAFIPGAGLTGPTQAKAASEAPGGAKGKAKAPRSASIVPVGLSEIEPSGDDLAKRLARFAKTDAQADTSRDAFAPSQQWLQEAGMVHAGDGNGPEGAAAFTADHHLRAVMGADNGQSAIAVVDDQSLRVGDRLDGFTLVKLGRRSAVFEGAGGAVTLTLAADK